jgi:hypothetical protein
MLRVPALECPETDRGLEGPGADGIYESEHREARPTVVEKKSRPVSRDARETVLVSEDAVSLRGCHHALPQLSEPPREQEIFQRLPENVTARDAFFLGNLCRARGERPAAS